MWLVLVIAAPCFAFFGGVPRTRIDVYDGKIAVQWDVRYDRDSAPRLASPSSVRIAETRDGKGRGAFATETIARGTFLGSYQGEELAAEDVNKESQYVLRVDSGLYIDGREAALGDSFTPALMNHCSENPNVVRYCSRRRNPAQVDFFADRDILKDEELLFDYGPSFWRKEDKVDLDTQWLDPENQEDQGFLLNWLKEKYRETPQTFEAAYIAVVFSSLVLFSQYLVRFYKHNFFDPTPLADILDSYDSF